MSSSSTIHTDISTITSLQRLQTSREHTEMPIIIRLQYKRRYTEFYNTQTYLQLLRVYHYSSTSTQTYLQLLRVYNTPTRTYQRLSRLEVSSGYTKRQPSYKGRNCLIGSR